MLELGYAKQSITQAENIYSGIGDRDGRVYHVFMADRRYFDAVKLIVESGMLFLRIFVGLYIKWWQLNRSYDTIVMQFCNIAIISEIVMMLIAVKLSVICKAFFMMTIWSFLYNSNIGNSKKGG